MTPTAKRFSEIQVLSHQTTHAFAWNVSSARTTPRTLHYLIILQHSCRYNTIAVAPLFQNNNNGSVTFSVQGLQTIHLTSAMLVVTPGDYPKDSVAQQVCVLSVECVQPSTGGEGGGGTCCSTDSPHFTTINTKSAYCGDTHHHQRRLKNCIRYCASGCSEHTGYVGMVTFNLSLVVVVANLACFTIVVGNFVI